MFFLLAVASLLFAANASDIPWSSAATSPRIAQLARSIEAGDRAALGEFWEEMQTHHSPLIEPDDANNSLVTFVYRGSATTTGVIVDCQMLLGRDVSVNRMTRLADTDVWFKTFRVRNDMRLGYSFVPNPTQELLNTPDGRIADPLNPKLAPVAPYMGRSILELPGAPPQPFAEPRQGIAAGKVEEVAIDSSILKARRTAAIYTPPGFNAARPEPYPLIVCFDGQAYRSPDYMPLPTISDNLIADGKIPPVVIVFVDQAPQPYRNIELSNNQPFLDFVVSELLPQVRTKWHATSDPARTVVTGSSAGGLAAAFFAFRRSDVFGNVLSQSGAFWPGKLRNDPDREWLTRQYASSAKLPVRFVLQVGLLERGPTPGNGPSILETNRHLRSVLESKGYDVRYSEIDGGHEPLNWRGGIADGLIQLLGADHAAVDAVQGIADAFKRHPVVVIGEWRHGIQQLGDFYIRLVRDPSIQNTVQDIVIEFASRNNQKLLDRYIAGEDVPIDELRHIWRDTTKVAAWEFPMYANWLTAIRDVNRTLPTERRFRVIAGDTAIDWSRVRTHDDWLRLGDNNISFAEAIQNEIATHRRALVVLGAGHVAKLGRNGSPNACSIVEARYPGALYVIIHHLIPHDPDEHLLQLPGRADAAALYDLKGTSLGSRPDQNGVPPIRWVDAWLYVGPADTMRESLPPPHSLESAYANELDRRSIIEWGELRARKFLGDALAQ